VGAPSFSSQIQAANCHLANGNEFGCVYVRACACVCACVCVCVCMAAARAGGGVRTSGMDLEMDQATSARNQPIPNQSLPEITHMDLPNSTAFQPTSKLT
jgi:hypothetical protein